METSLQQYEQSPYKQKSANNASKENGSLLSSNKGTASKSSEENKSIGSKANSNDTMQAIGDSSITKEASANVGAGNQSTQHHSSTIDGQHRSNGTKSPFSVTIDGDHHNQSVGTLSNDNHQHTERPKPPPLTIMDSATKVGVNTATPGPNPNEPKTPQTPGGSSIDYKSRKSGDKERKIGHRRVDDEGQVTYKKIQTSQIMGSIQLGIGHAVGSLASRPERDLLIKDFTQLETVPFTNAGSSYTPAHHYSDFRFKIYAPLAFRYFRDLFGIKPDDFLLSLCNEPLVELSNPGASGSVFYLSNDDNFIIKTVQLKEAEFLLKLLPGYYLNLNQNNKTLLPKFFGQYCYICGGKNVRIIVMNNLLPSYVKMHEKYDLKGSTYKRKASKAERAKSSPTFKDLDFMEKHPEGIFLEEETHTALIKTLTRDCRVLESFKIMDYSLLVGVHNLDIATKEKEDAKRQVQADHQAEMAAKELRNATRPSDSSNFENNKRTFERSKSFGRQRTLAYSTALESIQAEMEPIDQSDDIPLGGIPARNSKGERLLLYVGIIDILQSYRLKKKLEHTFKAMIHDGDTISVHRPSFYAQRFLDFLTTKVFQKIPSLDCPEIKGPHRKFRTLVSSYIGLGPAAAAAASRARAPSGNSESDSNKANTEVTDASLPSSVQADTSPLPARESRRRSTEDSSKYLRTAVIKQTANKHSVVFQSELGSDGETPNEASRITGTTLSGTAEMLASKSPGALRKVTWTPPHSIGTATPSHTEATDSFTESSDSEFTGMTPLRSGRTSKNSLANDVEELDDETEVTQIEEQMEPEPSTITSIAVPSSSPSLAIAADESATTIVAEAVSAAASTNFDSTAAPKPAKKKKTRCEQCRVNVGVISFPCRCGRIFCGSHRYAKEHNCTFDYKEHGAEEIRKNNPQIIGEKVQKI